MNGCNSSRLFRRRIIIVLFVIFVLVATASCGRIRDTRSGDLRRSEVNIMTTSSDNRSINVSVEIADTSALQAKGLMFRESLGVNEGMLFIFKEASLQSFWMKDTLIPLDIIFISPSGIILNIEEAIPCVQDPCIIYKSVSPAKYVLEVNAGFAEKNTINSGDSVSI